MEVTYTLEEDDGDVLGTGLLHVKSSMLLARTSGTWNEQITVTLVSTTGQVDTLNVAFDANCTSNCSMVDATPWSGSVTLDDGEQASGAVTYTDTPLAGSRDTLTSTYHMYVTQDGAIPTQPHVNWSNPRTIRCDSELSTTGCVVPDVQPLLELPISQYGAAAVTYAWAQQNLPDSWGYDTPLRRLADTQAADANRNNTCGSGSTYPFVPLSDDVVTDDSCDEYPFAATYEGGTNGGLCADIIPQYENGQWYIYEDANKPVTYNEPCVRGHVPQTQNSAAGGKYGNFVQNERVLDLERFYVWISA